MARGRPRPPRRFHLGRAALSAIEPRHGGWGDAERKAAGEVLRRVADAGVETVRVVFADQHGITRGKTIMAADMRAAFEKGVTATTTLLLKDTSHRTVFPVWQSDSGFGPGELTGAADFLMVPDPTTFRILPWSPKSGWMLSDICFADGRPIPFSSRHILKDAIERLNAKGWQLITGLEVEFLVYRIENPRLAHADSGMPHLPPETGLIAHGYQYLTEDRYDRLEEVMERIRLGALALGLPVRSMEAEFGPSQFEFTFHPAAGHAHADNMVLFRNAVKQICRREGLHATFMCRPKVDNAMANGWHLHQSLVELKSGRNLFVPEPGEPLSALGRQWVAGLLQRATESCLLTTPTINGYKRYQPYQLAPDRIQWGRDNRGAMIRALAVPGDPASRIENRVGESAANPYLYLASQALSGLDGIERGLEAPPPVDAPYDSQAPRLPTSLIEALDAFRRSAFYRTALGDQVVNYLAHIKQAEWNRYLSTVSEWEQREYFSLF